MRDEVRRIALEAKGFLAEREGLRLYELARGSSSNGSCLEIGSYCGKSALFLGEGCRETGRHPLFTVDHHRGSAEQQPGELYFDAELYDEREQAMTTLPGLMRNIRLARLEDWVIPVVAESTVLGRHWPEESLSLLFLDGGHSESDAFGDYRTWSRCVRPDGYLCIHDVFPDENDGGQAPYRVLCEARSAGTWEYEGMVETLAVLRRR
jgi:MMP 1-O-methyltransferase